MTAAVYSAMAKKVGRYKPGNFMCITKIVCRDRIAILYEQYLLVMHFARLLEMRRGSTELLDVSNIVDNYPEQVVFDLKFFLVNRYVLQSVK
jgi:hypothetical protein